MCIHVLCECWGSDVSGDNFGGQRHATKSSTIGALAAVVAASAVVMVATSTALRNVSQHTPHSAGKQTNRRAKQRHTRSNSQALVCLLHTTHGMPDYPMLGHATLAIGILFGAYLTRVASFVLHPQTCHVFCQQWRQEKYVQQQKLMSPRAACHMTQTQVYTHTNILSHEP